MKIGVVPQAHDDFNSGLFSKSIENRLDRPDDLSIGFFKIKELVNENGGEIDTIDNTGIESIDTCIFIDINFHYLYKILNSDSETSIIYVMREPPTVIPFNAAPNIYKYQNVFDKILTWNDSIVEQCSSASKYSYPNRRDLQYLDRVEQSFREKNLLVNVSQRKYSSHPNELYSEREQVIKYYEENHPTEFTLYGGRWKYPARLTDLFNMVFGHYHYDSWESVYNAKRISPPQYSVYNGEIQNKSEAYSRNRFALCFENTSGIPGYISEKIFDCFNMGIVPVYFGASNITDYIPTEAFIDYREFGTPKSLHEFLITKDQQDFEKYRQAARSFADDGWKEFSPDNFANTIYNAIIETPSNKKALSDIDSKIFEELQNRWRIDYYTHHREDIKLAEKINILKYIIHNKPAIIAERPHTIEKLLKDILVFFRGH